MSNFTKSVIYSTAVLAIGLVGIMAISNQGDGGQSGVAGIEPAAGESDMGVDFSKDIPAGAASAEAAAPSEAVEAQSEMNSALEAVEDEVIKKPGSDEIAAPIPSEESASDADAASAEAAPAEEGSEPAQDAAADEAADADEIAPASGLEGTAEQAQDAAEKAAEDTAKELGLEE